MSQSQPNWDSLPHDPRGFFGVAHDADLRDLKRAYNKLLRQFKPEKFPDEFQKIRAAYERLSEQIRYGSPGLEMPDLSIDNILPPSRDPKNLRQDDAHGGDTGVAATGRQPLSKRLDRETPDQIFRELQGRESLQPRDYVHLAVFSDTVESEDPHVSQTSVSQTSFIDWIIEGLSRYPTDTSLANLFRAYIDSESSADELKRCLRISSPIFPESRYYFLTEKGWDRLMRCVPFSEFRETLAACEKSHGVLPGASRLVFFVHLLRIAVWNENREWFDEKRSLLEDHYYDLPHWAQDEIEFVDELSQYQANREKILAFGPVARDIDRSMVAYCTLDQTDGDREVIRCQYEIAANGESLLDEIPLDPSLTRYYLPAWSRITSDVNERLGDRPYFDPQSLGPPVAHLVQRCSNRYNQTIRSETGTLIIFMCYWVALVAIYTDVLLAIRLFLRFRQDSGIWVGILLDVSLVLACTAVSLLLVRTLYGLGQRLAFPSYASFRKEFVKLLRVYPVSVAEIFQTLHQVKGKKVDGARVRYADVAAEGIINDTSMELAASALVTVATLES